MRTYSCKFNEYTASTFVGRWFEWRPANDLRALGTMARMRISLSYGHAATTMSDRERRFLLAIEKEVR